MQSLMTYENNQTIQYPQTNFAKASVVSYPNRDNRYGDNQYRGNCSGKLIEDLIGFFKPKHFTDVCEGGGTSRDVCKTLGIPYTGLDLRYGQDFTSDSVLNKLNGKHTSLCFSHPPYWNMIPYSGNMWNGKEKHLADTSHCLTVDEFLYKSQVMLMNQREATEEGGIYTTLIGDMKKKGVLYSFQSDFIQMMPKSELLNVVIKMQHNTHSENTMYTNRNFIPIAHEYLILWKKKRASMFAVGLEIASDLTKKVAATWRSVIRIVMMRLGKATLEDIYAAVENEAASLIANNPNWKAKIRQKLQKHHTNVNRGVWAA